MNASKISPLAQDHVTVYESPAPESIYCYSPGLAMIQHDGGNRIIATIDLGGPGVSEFKGAKFEKGEFGWSWQGEVFTSDDNGKTWTQRTTFPFMHARPFVSGNSIYVLGHAGDLTIIRSDDGGETWTDPVTLTEGEAWHQAPCNVYHTEQDVYLVMERIIHEECKVWRPSVFAPVLMRGKISADLTQKDNWTFASELAFRDTVPCEELAYFGVPFYETIPNENVPISPGRSCPPIGWLETNVVQFTDPDHIWHDPAGKTFHLWARAHTGRTGFAAIAKVIEKDDGTMETLLETAPSGKEIVYVPCPGGQMKFHILQDKDTGLFWLLSTQSTDSMIRPERMPDNRYIRPDNERRRLCLHFSKNCMDWCFAGLVAAGPAEHASRHYASMLINGNDLHVMSRSGDERAKSAHDTNLITFHTIPNFRELVY